MFGSYGANGAFISKYTPDAYLGSAEFFENVAGYALVGCASSAAGGGDCGSGALAAGMSSAAAPKVVTMDFYGGLATSATIGGVSSVAGGGKFWNGARTATYGYLFNDWAEQMKAWGAADAEGFAARDAVSWFEKKVRDTVTFFAGVSFARTNGTGKPYKAAFISHPDREAAAFMALLRRFRWGGMMG